MPWEVVKKHQGFVVRRAPPRDGEPDAYTADFTSRRLAGAPFRRSKEESERDGLLVMQYIKQVRQMEHEAQQALQGPIHTRPSGHSTYLTKAPLCLSAEEQEVLQGRRLEVLDGTPQQDNQDLTRSEAVGSRARARPGVLVHLSEVFDSELADSHVKLSRKLGLGGYGSVYVGTSVRKYLAEAIHDSGTEDIGMDVVVKVFESSRDGVSSELLQQLAARELRAVRMLQGHACAVKVLAAGQLIDEWDAKAVAQAYCASRSGTTEPPVECVVFEMMSNTLESYLDYGRRVNEAEAKGVALQLAQHLALLHSGQLNGKVIVHGDIKPDNILMRLNGSIAFCDFGSCRIGSLVEGSMSQVKCAVDIGCVFFTAYYAAPDLFHKYAGSGSGRDEGDAEPGYTVVNTSWDVFSFGVLILRMLVGPLEKLFAEGPKSIEAADKWEGVLAAIVNRQFQLPGVQLTDAALEFVGCACGVGAARDSAALQGQPKRLSAAQLLELPWLK